MNRIMERVSLTREERVELSDLLREVEDIPRPRTRAECVNGPRPCPWVSCRHHLYLTVNESGGIKINFDGEPWEMTESCALDVADRGGVTLDVVGQLLSVTRERIRQVERKALNHARIAASRKGLSRSLHEAVSGDRERPDLNDPSQSVESLDGMSGGRFVERVSAWKPKDRAYITAWKQEPAAAPATITEGDTMTKKHKVSIEVLEHIQKLRESGWSWAELAKAVGYSNSGLRNLLSGERALSDEMEAKLLAIKMESRDPGIEPKKKPGPKLKPAAVESDPAQTTEPTPAPKPPRPTKPAILTLDVLDTKIRIEEQRIRELEFRLQVLRELRAELA